MKGLERRPGSKIGELRMGMKDLDAGVFRELFLDAGTEKIEQAEELGRRVGEFIFSQRYVWENKAETEAVPISTFANANDALGDHYERALVVNLPFERYVIVVEESSRDLPLFGEGSRWQLRIQGGNLFVPGEERTRGDTILRAEVDHLNLLKNELQDRADKLAFKDEQEASLKRGKQRVDFLRGELSNTVVNYVQFSLTEASFDPNTFNEEAKRYGKVDFKSLITCRVSELVGSNEELEKGYGPLVVDIGRATGNLYEQFVLEKSLRIGHYHPMARFLKQAVKMRYLAELYPQRYER